MLKAFLKSIFKRARSESCFCSCNRLRNLVFKLADTGLLSSWEFLETDRTRRRPGDVSTRNWSFRRGLAIDVAVICPLADSHLGKSEPCESYAKHQKIDRYVGAFENS